MNTLLDEQPHRRFNALTGDWVFVSPHRTKRPWQGRMESPAAANLPSYDPGCYLCPGNVRANGARNPPYPSTYVFDNDFSAFLPDTSNDDLSRGPLLRAHSQAGVCRVICYSPRHDLTLAGMSTPAIRGVVDLWAEQVSELEQRWQWVQVFENKGETMGCSNPHPHGQIWASDFVPVEATKELVQQRHWLERHGTRLLVDYAATEIEARERVVVSNEHWVVVVPWWAVWPFETLVLPRSPIARLYELSTEQRDALALALGNLLRGYDKLFDISFPYSFGWHGAPADASRSISSAAQPWQLHAHCYPPLLRSATVRKFMVGYEMLAEAQRDLTPEQAAERLRNACQGAVDDSPGS